jgi:hypothetical protein
MVTVPQPEAEPSMLEYALGYLMDRRPIFPVCFATGKGRCLQHGACSNPGKLPLVAWKRYQTELPTEADVARWWGGKTQANIGMATGDLSGVVVLDTDSGDAWKEALRRGIPNTPSVRTGKPGGCHFHFQHPGVDVSNFAGKLAGIDFRGDGGYVLLPPSQHASGPRYRWIEGTQSLEHATVPDWLMELLAANPGVNGTASGEHAPLDLDLILRGVPEGQRDETIWRYACKLRGDDVPLQYAETMVRQAARLCRPPFNEDAAAEKVRRAYRGYQPSVVLEVPEGGLSAPGHEPVKVILADPEPTELDYPIQTLAELMARPVQEIRELVEGLLFAGRTTWIFSDPNAGKTITALALGLHIAAGVPFCGLEVQQGAVLLLEEDSSLEVIKEYVDMLSDIYGFDLDTMPFYINTLQGLRVTDARGIAMARLAIKAAVDRSEETLVLVIWDTTETLVPSDKFSTREFDPFGQCLRATVNDGIANAVLDHTRKPPQQGVKGAAWKPPTDPASLLELLYGSRAKSAIADVMIHLGGGLKGTGIRATFCKMRGELPAPVDIQFQPDTGFTVSPMQRETRTPTEQKIVKWLNSQPVDWYLLAEIIEGSAVPHRSGVRALIALRQRRLVQRDDSRGDKSGARYRLNSVPDASFS